MLNPEQQAAVEHSGTPLVIYAGPGTGKTLVLQKKYEHLISKGINPHKILGITFTRSAARELSERIAKNCKIHQDNVTTLTFHAFCLNILRRYTFYAELIPGFKIVDPTEQDNIIHEALKENALPFTPNHIILIKQVISRIKKRQQSATAENHIEEYGRIVYPIYQNTLKKQNKIDYDDIIEKGTIALNIDSILSEYQNIYQYIMLDEAQDTTIPQSEIIYKLNCPNITIVGDQNQAIYSFAGANPSFMQEFQAKTNAHIIHLKQNYRNPQRLIDAANTIIQYNQNYIDSELFAEKTYDKGIAILQTINETNEAQLIANAISHNALKNVSILYRRNENARLLEIALQKKVIPYEINGLHFHDRKEIKETIELIKYAYDPTDIELFRELLINRTGIGKQTIERIITQHQETGDPLLECAQRKLTRITKEQHLTLKKLFSTIQRSLKLPDYQALKLLFKEAIIQPSNKSQAENLKTFQILLENRQESIKEIIEYIEESKRKPDVKLMTLHSAKGTENDTIFIIGVEERLIPDENSFINIKAIEEERRLFYVGLTRTRKTLVLSYARNRTINGLKFTQQPSRFLNEIPEKSYL